MELKCKYQSRFCYTCIIVSTVERNISMLCTAHKNFIYTKNKLTKKLYNIEDFTQRLLVQQLNAKFLNTSAKIKYLK